MAQNNMGPIFNNQGIITQGQQGNNTIIQGPIARHLTDQDKSVILQRIPKSRTVKVMAQIGDPETADYANEWQGFLASSGYTTEGPIFGMFFMGKGGSPRDVNIYLKEETPSVPVEIIIGPR